jgi:hypothetical protein
MRDKQKMDIPFLESPSAHDEAEIGSTQSARIASRKWRM